MAKDRESNRPSRVKPNGPAETDGAADIQRHFSFSGGPSTSAGPLDPPLGLPVRDPCWAPSLKEEWPQFVTNKRIYDAFMRVWKSHPSLSEFQVSKSVAELFPRFSYAEIGSRVRTWELTEEFRAKYSADSDDDEIERIIDARFQYFRQAHYSYRRKDCYEDPEFRGLVFEGIKNDLFPSFTGVRKLGAIYDCPSASKIFLEGIGLTFKQKKENFILTSSEAYKAEAEKRPSIQRVGEG